MAQLVISTRTGSISAIGAPGTDWGHLVRWPDFVFVEVDADAIDLPSPNDEGGGKIYLNVDALPAKPTRADVEKFASPSPAPSEVQAALREAHESEVLAWRDFKNAYGRRKAIESEPDQIIARAKAAPWLREDAEKRAAMLREATSRDLQLAQVAEAQAVHVLQTVRQLNPRANAASATRRPR